MANFVIQYEVVRDIILQNKKLMKTFVFTCRSAVYWDIDIDGYTVGYRRNCNLVCMFK